MCFRTYSHMVSEAIETGVDDLIRFLKNQGKTSIKETAKAINVKEQTLQLWVDFLVEERVLGIEYKFTKPYIFLNSELKEKPEKNDEQKTSLSLHKFKKDFYEDAKKKKLPADAIQPLWRKHLTQALDSQEEVFIREAKKRNLAEPKRLFEQYKAKQLDV